MYSKVDDTDTWPHGLLHADVTLITVALTYTLKIMLKAMRPRPLFSFLDKIDQGFAELDVIT